MSDQRTMAELREKVALSCRILGARGATKSTFGHVSARIPDTDHVLIRAKGPEQEALQFATRRDVIRIDLEGAVVEAPAGLEAPNETPMHLAIYRARPEVMSVIHSHPHWVVVLTASGKPLVPMYGAYDGAAGLRLLDAGIPTYPRTVTIINDALAAEYMETMGNSQVCLLRGHGLTVAGASIEEATTTTLSVVELAYLNYLAYAIGGPLPVPDLDDHRQRWTDRGHRPHRWAANAAGEPSEWRYQKTLLEHSAPASTDTSALP